jgi:hypothetical protein
LLSGITHKPVQQQFIEPNTLISLLFVILLRTSSVSSVPISDGVDITIGDDQTLRAQLSSGGRPRIFSRNKEEDISLFDEIGHSQESTSPEKRDDLISCRRSPSRLFTMTSTAHSYKFTESAAVSGSSGDEV